MSNLKKLYLCDANLTDEALGKLSNLQDMGIDIKCR